MEDDGAVPLDLGGPPIVLDLGVPEVPCTTPGYPCEPHEMCGVFVPGVPGGGPVQILCEDLPKACVAAPSCACVEPILELELESTFSCSEDGATPITIHYDHW